MNLVDLGGLSSTQALYCVAALGIAGLAHGMFGFGFAMIATPLLALTLDYQSAILGAAVPLFCMATLFLIMNRRALRNESLTRVIVPGVVVGSVIGSMLQAAMPQYLTLSLLALLLVLNAQLPRLLGRVQADSSRLANKPASTALGTLAGITEAALNVGAPFILIYGTTVRLNRVQQLLALNLCFSVGKAIQIGALAQASSQLLSLPLLSLATIFSIGGYMIGNRFGGRFSELAYRRHLTTFLYAMAIFLLCRAVWSAM